MLALIKQYRKWIYITLIPYIFIITISLYRVDYYITTPGGITEITDSIIIEGAPESDGAFYTVYVSSFRNPTQLQVWIAQNLNYANVRKNVPVSDYEPPTDKEVYEVGRLQYDLAMQYSIIHSFEISDAIIEYEYQGVLINGISNFNTNDALDIGDVIIAFDGVELTSRTQFIELSNAYTCDEEVDVRILKEDGTDLYTTLTKTSVNDYCKYGLIVTDNYIIQSTSPSFELPDTRAQGPSGGLLRALSIYNDLIPEDITHGLRIGGTGTLSVDGNVGYIGGVEQKIAGAIREGIDIFFVPHLNDEPYDDYIEALAVYNEFNTDMKLVGVATFEEALNYLLNYEDGNE